MSTYPTNNIGRELIPLTLINQTNRGNLYFYLVGTTEPTNPANNWYYLSDFKGNVSLCQPTGNQQTTYSLKLADNQTILMPRLSAIRIYFSFDRPLYLAVGDNGIPNSPAGWLTDNNFNTLFDWVELTWEVNTTDMTLGGNTTQVDMFGLPFSLQLTGFDAEGKPLTQQGGFQTSGLRNKMISQIKKSPSPWNQLVFSDATGFDNRVISPYHGMEMKVFPKDQLDTYINQIWQKYTTEPLTAIAENVTFTGNVKDGNLIFTAPDCDPIIFPKPDSFMVYTSGPMPTVNTGKSGVIQAALQASFMRSTLLVNNTLPACDSSQYYQNDPVNFYAKTFHQFGTDGGAYAFGFDDVCSKSSFIIVHNPQSLQITLLGF